MLQFAMGFLHYSPQQFWLMTLTEFLAGQNGWLRANGHELEEDKPQLTQEWYADLIKQVDGK